MPGSPETIRIPYRGWVNWQVIIPKSCEGKTVTLVPESNYEDKDKYGGCSDIFILKTVLLLIKKSSKTDMGQPSAVHPYQN